MENFMNEIPSWYFWIATILTVYQGVRGFVLQKKFADFQNSTGTSPNWAKAEMFWIRSLADGLFYLASTAAGFLSLFLAYRILNGIPSIDEIETGTSILTVFLLSFGFLGATGQRPHLVQEGKFPWSK